MLQAKPTHLTFEQLKCKIESGNILIPQFQREFVWKIDAAAKLLDSIVKGYPIGSFILWETKERLRHVKKIGGISLPSAKKGDSLYYVLDGQQRLTSIYASLCGVTIDKDDYAEIYVDLDADETQEIITIDMSERNENSLISINSLLDNNMLVELITKYASNNGYIQKIQAYQRKFHEYQFPIIEITDADLNTATDIFTRINIYGKSLDIFEIMCAKTYDEEKEFDLFERREKQKERWQDIGFETVPHSTVLQAISICLNGGCSKKHILNNIDKKDFIGIWDSIDECFNKAIDHIKKSLGMVVSKLLPYDCLLVPFVYYFYKHPNTPSASDNKLLKDYFWRCVLTSRFSDGLENKLSQDITHVIDKIINGEEPKYEQGIDVSCEFIRRNGAFSTGSALIKGLLCLLTSQNPLSFKNNNPVIVDNAWLSQGNSKNYHHFFPKNYMKTNQHLIDENLVNHIANITIVDSSLNKGEIKDKAPSEYMKKFYDANSEIKSAMKTHLIGDFDEFGIWKNNYNIFFEKRIQAIVDELKNHLILRSIDIV